MKLWHVAVAVAAVALAGLGYYLISPLFRVVRLDDPEPVSAPAQQMVAEVPPPIPVESPPPTSAPVVGTAGHPASGTARIVIADGRTYVRYENFKTINGPDIYVYLAKDLDANEFVSLGRVRATEGSVNYEVPAGGDVAAYPYVLTWCKMFGVLFNYAALSPA